jgi:hypothetical protein
VDGASCFYERIHYLCGPNSCGGQPGVKPFIAGAMLPSDKKYIEKFVRLMYSACLPAACGAVSLRYFP